MTFRSHSTNEGYSTAAGARQAFDHLVRCPGEQVRRETNLADTVVPVDVLVDEGLAWIDTLYERGDTITGVPTGFYDLDAILSGLHGGDLIVLGARPAVGKFGIRPGHRPQHRVQLPTSGTAVLPGDEP